jgi:2,4-dienoyl-CoA reductase-like NADH-dependent reductase (Old Yellow Enzyme family)
VRLARLLADHGVDLVDVSSAGITPAQQIPLGPGYQVPFAQRIRAEAKVPTGAVGLITEPQQAEQIVATGAADVVFLARALLRDPHWPLNAARVLGGDIEWPIQYVRARLER